MVAMVRQVADIITVQNAHDSNEDDTSKGIDYYGIPGILPALLLRKLATIFPYFERIFCLAKEF